MMFDWPVFFSVLAALIVWSAPRRVFLFASGFRAGYRASEDRRRRQAEPRVVPAFTLPPEFPACRLTEEQIAKIQKRRAR